MDSCNSNTAELEQKSKESEVDNIKRLKESVEKQCIQIQGLIASNAIMAESLAKTNGVSIESLKQSLEEKYQQLESVKSEKAELESKDSMYQDFSKLYEPVLRSMINVVVEFGNEEAPSLETDIRVKAREEIEAEVNRLLVLLGQEQSKVERLSERVSDLGKDVEELLKGIVDDTELFEEKQEENVEILVQAEEKEDNSELPEEVTEENEEDNDAEIINEGEDIEDSDDVILDEDEENKDDAELLKEESEEEIEDNDDEILDEDVENEDETEFLEEKSEEENEDNDDEILDDGEENEEKTELLEESEEVDNSGSNEDSSVESLIDRISNGDRPDDRRKAMSALVNILAYGSDLKLEFGDVGISMLTKVLKEECNDTEMVKSTLSVLNNALNSTYADSFSREADNILLLISLLDVDDFLVRMISLKILSRLVQNFPERIHEAILNTPGAVIKFVDMITNDGIGVSAMNFLIQFTREAKEIQKIVASEGAFEKIFSTINEEGGSEGGHVVEVCLELLNNLLLKNKSNQILFQETIGFEPLLSLLELDNVTNNFPKIQRNVVLSGLNTISILSTECSEADTVKDSSSLTIKTTLVQKNIFDHLLMLSVECQAIPVEIRCSALKCIGDFINGNIEFCDALATKVLGEEPKEPALNLTLRTILRTSSTEEFTAADYIFKSFCEKNPKGQAMLASSLIDEEAKSSFGRLLQQGFTLTEKEGDLEICCRAASVLSHILKDNNQCKKRALEIKFESSEPLMLVVVKRLTIASFVANKSPNSYVKPALLKLLVIWLSDCPEAVKSFLDSHPNLTLLLDFLSNESESELTKNLAALVLGECVIYNESLERNKDSFSVVRAITQKVELTSYFRKFVSKNENENNLYMSSIFDALFATLVKSLEGDIKEKIADFYSHPKSNEAVVPTELEQKSGEESESDYLERLKEFLEKQRTEMQDLLSCNVVMTEKLKRADGVPIETLLRDLHRTSQQIKLVYSEKDKVRAEALMHREISDKLESELNRVNGTRDEYNYKIACSALPDIEAIKAKAKANSLLVWLGHEQSKVVMLKAKLMEFGEDINESLI